MGVETSARGGTERADGTLLDDSRGAYEDIRKRKNCLASCFSATS
jgi:hypothetical protein